jgi:hypothetical protein
MNDAPVHPTGLVRQIPPATVAAGFALTTTKLSHQAVFSTGPQHPSQPTPDYHVTST